MGNTLLLIITALVSGLIATLVTIWWQSRVQKKNEKIKIFEILMAKRYEISAEESVDALNKIDVVFYDSDKVRKAWKDFGNAAKSSELQKNPQLISDKHLKLLEEISKDIGYNKIHWDDIKEYYFPEGLSNRKQDEFVLRRVQIDAGLAQIKNANNENNVVQANKNDELAYQLLIESMKNPDRLLNLMKVAEKAQKFNK